jgi:hypothetical protein
MQAYFGGFFFLSVARIFNSVKRQTKESIITSSNRPDVDFDANSLLDAPNAKKIKPLTVDPEIQEIDSFLSTIFVPENEVEYLPCQVRIACRPTGNISFIGKLENFNSSYRNFEVVVLVALEDFKNVYSTLTKLGTSNTALVDLEILSENASDNSDEENSEKENFVALPLTSNTQSISNILFNISTKNKGTVPVAKITIICGP